jgi:hypothetical protein
LPILQEGNKEITIKELMTIDRQYCNHCTAGNLYCAELCCGKTAQNICKRIVTGKVFRNVQKKP